MEEVQSFNIQSLRYEEDFNFLKKVSKEADLHLNKEGDEPMVTEFDNAVTAFDEALKINTSNPFSSEVKAAIDNTDQLWRGMRNQLKGMLTYPDKTKSDIAHKAYNMVEKYGDITKMSQGERYGNAFNLVQDLLLIKEEDLNLINIEIWVYELNNSCGAYDRAYASFTEEELKYPKGIAKQRREEADDAYKLLIKRVNAKAITFEDGRHNPFIKNVNFIIDKEKTKLASRQTRAQKKKENEKDNLPSEANE